MRSSHRPRPKQANDVVARSWPRGLSSLKPAAPGTPLGPLMPIGQQQHTQHVAEARSALARGAMMASTRRCAIVLAMRGQPCRQAALRNAKLPAWPELFFSARAHARQTIDRPGERGSLFRGTCRGVSAWKGLRCYERRGTRPRAVSPTPHCGTRVSAERGLRGKSSKTFRERRVTGARKYGGLFHYRQRAGFQNQTGVELTQRAPATAQAPPILTAIVCFGSTPVSESPPRRAPGHPETTISEEGLIARVD